MIKKGLGASENLEETPNLKETANKPLYQDENRTKKVDINILKARAQEIENKESRKNISIFVFFVAILGAIGIYLYV